MAGQAVPRMTPIDLADPYTEHRVAAALEAVYLRRSDAIISRQDGASQGSGVEPLDWTLQVAYRLENSPTSLSLHSLSVTSVFYVRRRASTSILWTCSN